MTEPSESNPYRTPDNDLTATGNNPGHLESVSVAILSVFSGFAAMFGTCIGSGLLGFTAGPDGLGAVIGIVSTVFLLSSPFIGLFVASRTRQSMLARHAEQPVGELSISSEPPDTLSQSSEGSKAAVDNPASGDDS